MPVIFTVKFHYLHFPPLLLLVPHPFTFKFHTTLKIILYLQIPVLANSKTTDLQPVLANSYNPFLSMFKKTCRRRHITVEGRLLFCFFIKCNLRLRQRLISHLVHLENATAARDSYTLLLSFYLFYLFFYSCVSQHHINFTDSVIRYWTIFYLVF